MKFTARFKLLNRSKAKDQLCGITLILTYNRVRRQQDTGLLVHPDQFDEIAASKGQFQIVKHRHDAISYNEILRNQLDKALGVYRDLVNSGEPFTVDTIKAKIKYQGINAADLFEELLFEQTHLSEKTINSLSTTITRLREFDKNILASEIDYSFAKRFEKWLLTVPSMFGGALKKSTVNTYMSGLIRLLRICVKHEFLESNKLEYYDKLKITIHDKKEKEFLTLEEIKHLENFDFTALRVGEIQMKSIEQTRDLFLFGCYTGLRLQDLLTISKSHLKDDVLTIKTDKGKGSLVHLPIKYLFNGKPLQIFNKYTKHRLPKTPIFEFYSRATYQRVMRCFIRLWVFQGKDINIHSGRHTFATILIDLGMDLMKIKDMLGHKTLDTTIMNYYHQSMQKTIDETKKVFGEYDEIKAKFA